MKIQDIKELSPPLAVQEMFIYLNKKYSNLVEPLARALAEMKKDGSYERIVKNQGI